jgi:hypothetical protein
MKLSKKELEAKARECFEYNKGAKKAYITSDGTAFLSLNDAKNYASTLGSTDEAKNIEVFEDAEEISESKGSSVGTNGGDKPLDKMNKAELTQKYQEVIGNAPDEALTKKELEVAIVEALEKAALDVTNNTGNE